MNKTALITGASRGIGRATAIELAKSNIDIIFTYNKDEAAAKTLVEELSQIGVQSKALQIDVSEYNEYEKFVTSVEIALTELNKTKLDVLINNAGNSNHTEILNTTEEEFDELYRIHLKAPFFITKMLIPLIRKDGVIINTSTALTRFSVKGSGSYAAMKSAIETVTKYMAVEFGDKNIRVNVIAPGPIQTDFSGGMVRDNASLNEQLAGMTPLGRVGLPDDVAKVTANLVNQNFGFVTGQRLEIAGGLSI